MFKISSHPKDDNKQRRKKYKQKRGRRGSPPQPTTSEAIQKLREMEEMLCKKQEYLEVKIAREVETAKRNARTNRTVALSALKRKKRLQAQLQQIDGTLTTLEQQRMSLEDAHTNVAVLDSMKHASSALKNAHNKVNMDEFHDMMDDFSEMIDLNREISDAISNPVGFPDMYEDEDELEAELAEMFADEEAERKTAQTRREQKLEMELEMPNVPSHNLTAKKSRRRHRHRHDYEVEDMEKWIAS